MSDPGNYEFKIGQRLTVCAGWDQSYRAGTVLGPPVVTDGVKWTPVLWDDQEDPAWHKAAGLVAEVADQTHTILLTLKTKLSFLDTVSTVVGMCAEKFSGCCATGVDPKAAEEKLSVALEERNLAMAELHRVRCEREAFEANSDQRKEKFWRAERAAKDASRLRKKTAERRLKQARTK